MNCDRFQIESKCHSVLFVFPGSNLDDMLGSLTTDMTKQGVTIVAKGNCAACDNPIVGQVLTNANFC